MNDKQIKVVDLANDMGVRNLKNTTVPTFYNAPFVKKSNEPTNS